MFLFLYQLSSTKEKFSLQCNRIFAIFLDENYKNLSFGIHSLEDLHHIKRILHTKFRF